MIADRQRVTQRRTGVGAPPAADASAQSRLWQIDAARGVMLVLMTITHIPTRFSDPLGQPLGFVSAAEGFVLLSGFMAGMVYTRRRLRKGEDEMRGAFLRRALTLYLCQAGLLAFLLTVVTMIGLLMHQPAITNLVSFYLEKPFTALIGGLLLLYNPPLLDILPMYVIFMLLSPVVLLHGAHQGFGPILVISAAVWIGAQFGVSQAAYEALVLMTGLPVPYRQTGAFDLAAWQFLWVIGLWMGAGHGAGRPVQPTPFPRWAVVLALAYALVSLVWRHAVGQTPFPGNGVMNLPWDKWQLGPMRLINVLALTLLAMHYREMLARRLPRVRALETLGEASLPVFCAHLVLALLVLAFFGAAKPERAWLLDVALLGGSLLVLYGVAVVSRTVDRQARRAGAAISERRDRRRLQPSP